MAAISEQPVELAMSPPDVPWLLPAVAERYECHERLGQGMFGDVYRAWDRKLKRFVAVKRLSGRTDDRFVATPLGDFDREVKSLAACLGHPSVVRILDWHADRGRADGDSFVVTEYAGPMNLRQYMLARRRNGHPFDEGEVRDVMEQLLAGATHAHGAGVVHRDIVPENVIVDMEPGSRRMVYKICGFGMSKPAAEADEDGSGTLASSSPYRAPELFLGCDEYDGRVDTWSLGCIMAELIAGDGVPFFSASDAGDEVLKKMLYIVGSRGILEWPRLERMVPHQQVDFVFKMGSPICQKPGQDRLQERFPAQLLSPAGFKVLKGLLHSSPDCRLSAAAALTKSWFRRRRRFFGARTLALPSHSHKHLRTAA